MFDLRYALPKFFNCRKKYILYHNRLYINYPEVRQNFGAVHVLTRHEKVWIILPNLSPKSAPTLPTIRDTYRVTYLINSRNNDDFRDKYRRNRSYGGNKDIYWYQVNGFATEDNKFDQSYGEYHDALWLNLLLLRRSARIVK